MAIPATTLVLKMNDFTNNISLRIRQLLDPLLVGYLMRTGEEDKTPPEEEVTRLSNMLIEDIFMIFREEKEEYNKQQEGGEKINDVSKRTHSLE